jgi:hypothetical protein
MLATIALGIVVGMSAGIWFLFTISSIHTALAKNGAGIGKRALALLGLPAFVGGGTWTANATLIPTDMLTANLPAYFSIVALVILSINAAPCNKLVASIARNME